MAALNDIRALVAGAEKHGNAGRHAEAYQVLLKAWALGKADAQSLQKEVALFRELKLALWRYAPHWWDRHASKRVILRRCAGSDADFFKRCLADPSFTHNFARHFGWTGDLAQALDKYGRLPPNDLKMLIWVICDIQQNPLGLITLSSLDIANRKAEYSLGLLGKPPAGVAVEASLLSFHHAYFLARLHRLYCYIYEDNPLAPRNALRLGFRAEGRLVDHAFLSGRYVTIQAFGLTRPQLQDTPFVVDRARRYIGKDWTVSVPAL